MCDLLASQQLFGMLRAWGIYIDTLNDDCAIFIRSSATTIRFHDIDAFPQIPRLSEIEFYSTALTLRCIIARFFLNGVSGSSWLYQSWL